jgi:bifunctional UDP-N-acetylglucosamine pyrophosphorylase / glucosamine-1-phosphate N-acetyltransferase
MHKVQYIILAAGKGTRMGSDLPKVLAPLSSSTMIEVLLDHLDTATKPILVVGYQAELVQSVVGDRAIYVTQAQQLGTGHAVIQAQSAINSDTETIIVLYGDHPLVDQVMVDKLLASHHQSQAQLTLATVEVDNFDDWRQAFVHYGRVINDDSGEAERIVEYKDASASEREVTTVNPAYFVFDKDWLFEHLEDLRNNNSQHEYYLTDLVQIAFNDQIKINTVAINPIQGLGANTPEQLAILEQFIN